MPLMLTMLIGVSSLSGSNVSFLVSGLTVNCAAAAKIERVAVIGRTRGEFGADDASRAALVLDDEAADRTFSPAASRSNRASVSLTPPGPLGTTTFTGRVGQSCAAAEPKLRAAQISACDDIAPAARTSRRQLAWRI